MIASFLFVDAVIMIQLRFGTLPLTSKSDVVQNSFVS